MTTPPQLAIGTLVRAAALISICVLGLLTAYSLGSNNTKGIAEGKALQSFFENDQSDSAAASCGTLAGNALVRCVVDVVSKTSDALHNRLDLVAQQTVADWTKWMVAISAIQVLFAVAGLLWVARTFSQSAVAVKASVDALELSKQTFELENRPWLKISDLVVTKVRARSDRLRVNPAFKIENFGKTPANSVEIICNLYPFSLVGNVEELFLEEILAPPSEWTRPMTIASGSIIDGHSVGVYWYAEEEISQQLCREVAFVLMVGVRYRGMFGNQSAKYTATAMFVSAEDDEQTLSPGAGYFDLYALRTRPTNRLDAMR